jgi:hypothetical protein
MNNIAASLVESYIYSDMYNREYNGGAPEKIHVGGAPVDYIASSLKLDDDDEGNQKGGGKLANKVVPAGLVMIQVRKDPDVEFEETHCPEFTREVVPHDLFDRLFDSILHNSKSRKYENHRKTPRKQEANRKRSRKST